MEEQFLVREDFNMDCVHLIQTATASTGPY